MGYYRTTYGTAQPDAMRREIYGRDIGQNSWLTAEQQEHFARLAGFTHKTALLEIGCGAGGPGLFLCEALRLSLTGIDSEQAAIDAANAAAKARGLNATFLCADARAPLPFEAARFDAVECTDAINHLGDRAAVLGEWRRVLKPGGVAVYTDPVVVTGQVTPEEFALRSAIGDFVYLPAGENERLLGAAGFALEATQDLTESEADISARRIAAREKRRAELAAREGADGFESTQRFLAAVHALSASRRLSRLLFVARKT